MCDYSLCGLPTRLAAEGEELVVHRFRSGSMGLASPMDLWPTKPTMSHARKRSLWERVKSIFEDPANSIAVTAVCVPPGAQLLLKDVPNDLQRQWNVAEEEGAFFVQTSADVNRYRDAISFRVGPPILLQNLREGMRVQVLSLGNAFAESERESVAPAQ